MYLQENEVAAGASRAIFLLVESKNTFETQLKMREQKEVFFRRFVIQESLISICFTGGYMKAKGILALLVVVSVAWSCSSESSEQTSSSGSTGGSADVGQSNVQDNESQKNVVGVAIGSKDHSTLVTALKTAELVDELSNAGPFTVFAPTNAAFDQLPAGTLDNLVKAENREQLTNILYHHVQVSIYSKERLASMGKLMMFDSKPETIEMKGDDLYIGGAKVLAEVRASNGVVYVIDKVLLPK